MKTKKTTSAPMKKTSKSKPANAKSANAKSALQKGKPEEILIGVVTSRFNPSITAKLEDGALSFFEEQMDLDVPVNVLSIRVPGAVEIPLACQMLIEQGCDGVVALGAVVRGETSHYDYVCNSVETGITRLMLDYNVPIGFGVLTTETEEQALERAGGKHGNKGYESAQVVMEMIGLQNELYGAQDQIFAKKSNSKK